MIRFTKPSTSIPDQKKIEALQVENAHLLDKLSVIEQSIRSDSIMDECGNIYKQVIQNDGSVQLVMTQSHTGELFER